MGVIIKKLAIPNIERDTEEKFVNELEALCRKYAGKDFYFDWEDDKKMKKRKIKKI